ncbi:hypothetical protein GALMADRAFT_243809 [Galerina marginata CBS 339.88]|uniref:Uncharacterized protein n=1 Tax=Galerina marginata (strain CBS 339.88) TaxID=685588 RepID=A0A067T5R6_GALM3|nr:hypothetical protein GALMADRAFT_243809 [Galerina marginata CBS 339.88]
MTNAVGDTEATTSARAKARPRRASGIEDESIDINSSEDDGPEPNLTSAAAADGAS